MEKKQANQELKVISNSRPAPTRGMGRREAVQRLLAGAGGVLVVPGLALGHPMHKHLADEATVQAADAKAGAADWAPEFLDAQQNETLFVLAERVIPGSSKAQVNRFIDLLLTVDTQDSQKKFLASMGAIEGESRSRFGHPFQALTEDQQNKILDVASTEKPGNPAADDNYSWLSSSSNGIGVPIRVTLRDHFDNLKGWISGAYYSSEVGMRELGWTGQVMFESFTGCEHPDGHSSA